jgi:dimethylhistidine N-methyltransferase
LSSKYFYNEKGDKLFQAIMASQEYYLTRAELEIFENEKEQISGIFRGDDSKPFELIELGAGDGSKTKVLLEYLYKAQEDFTYMPIDISGHVVSLLEKTMRQSMPDLSIKGITGDYFEILNDLKSEEGTRKIILFLGSNIGNFKRDAAITFLKQVRNTLEPNDLMMIGFDLIKDPEVILAAYNDKQGFTREFNLNLLDRINEELGANFERSKFIHYPLYDPVLQQARSYIICTKACDVHLEATGKTYHFDTWEYVHTEISQKFSFDDIESLASASGFDHETFLLDCKHHYTDAIWKAV